RYHGRSRGHAAGGHAGHRPRWRGRMDRSAAGALARILGGVMVTTPARRDPASHRNATSTWMPPIIAGAALLALWEALPRLRLPDLGARPSGIIMALPTTLADPAFWVAAASILGSILEGVVIGSVLGIAIGVTMGRVREINWLMTIYIRTLYSLP